MQSPMQVPAGAPTGMPPQPPPVYWAPPPPARPSRRLPLVIAAVVVIVIVVLAATYFLFFASSKPTVQFGAPIDIGSGFAVQVLSVSQALPPSSYRVNLLADGVAGTAVPMALYMNLTVSAVAYQAVWVDLNADGRLTAGDGFGVIRPGGLPAALYTFQILWSDGSVVGSATFQPSGGGRPVVTFTSPSASATGFGFDVAGVSQTLSASNYEVALEVNATLSTPVTLAASMSFTLGADTYTVQWTDIGGEGDLTGGDSFAVTRAGGLPPATTFTFFLVWSDDGSTIATVNYTT